MTARALLELLASMAAVLIFAVLAWRLIQGQRLPWYLWILLVITGLVTAIFALSLIVIIYVFFMFRVVPWLASLF